jgi:hypothetical protein
VPGRHSCDENWAPCMMVSMPPPTKQQIELRVNQVVTQLLASGSIEDDLVECKSEWPDPVGKARQLAGMANRSAPDPMIWIIGVDETERRLTNPPGVEVSDWLAKLEKAFDGGAPALIHHLNIILPTGEQVTALTFETDRAPYVVNVGGQGRVEREVPYRSGTGTRSAKRAELLGMLVPSVALPQCVILQAQFEMNYVERPDGGMVTDANGSLVLFVDLSERTALMPNHTMTGTVGFKSERLALNLKAWSPEMAQGMPAPRAATGMGVVEVLDGLLVTAPGSGNLGFTARYAFTPSLFFAWALEHQLELNVQIGVTGVSRHVHLRTTLNRVANVSDTLLASDAGGRTAKAKWKMID